MLTELRIGGLGVIEHAELSLGPGLTVLTGETGAGKTMVLTALGLLLGGRADTGAVRLGVDRAEVEGRIDVSRLPDVVHRAEDAGATVEDGELVVARTVGAEGRSRAVLGGRTVPVSVLADLGDDLVAVHGQSAQVALVRPDRQRDLLDAFGAPATLDARARVAELHAALTLADAEVATLRETSQAREQEVAELRRGLAEVRALAPQPGEDEALLAEQARLAHADRLRETVGAALATLAGDESATDSLDATGLLAAARRSLDGATALDPSLEGPTRSLSDAAYLLADVCGDLARYLADLEVDPQRLAAVNERRAALAALSRRYGGDVAGVLAWADAASRRLLALDADPGRIEGLEQECGRLRQQLGQATELLSAVRAQTGERLAEAVGAELAALAMPGATLTVRLTQRDDPRGVPFSGRLVACAPHGADQVEMLLAAHPGVPGRPLDKGASGGELSRTMLALEVVLAAADPVPTLVFDEVDAGVGGRAAVDVGRRLARLARHAQVLVVTHLAQVAAFADRHYVVSKGTDGRVISSGVRQLDDAGRLDELARMMAGLQGSAAARRHAEELLATASADA